MRAHICILHLLSPITYRLIHRSAGKAEQPLLRRRLLPGHQLPHLAVPLVELPHRLHSTVRSVRVLLLRLHRGVHIGLLRHIAVVSHVYKQRGRESDRRRGGEQALRGLLPIELDDVFDCRE